MRTPSTRRRHTRARSQFTLAATGLAAQTPTSSILPSPTALFLAAGGASPRLDAPAPVGSTIVTLGASPASPAALAVGESVTVTPAASEAASAAGVTVLLVRVTGSVSSVTRDTLTVSTADGVDVTIVTTPSMTVTLDGSPTAPPTLAVGDHVTAEGLITPSGVAVPEATARRSDRVSPAARQRHAPAWTVIRDWFSATALSVAADLSAS